jgi:ABC-type antimicrobial peptide transport system permease subunit
VLPGIGLILGLMVSSALSTVLRSLLYDAEIFQVSSLLVPTALLGLGSLIAGALPAAQASRVDPMIALSGERRPRPS